jgi:hypothetical protein
MDLVPENCQSLVSSPDYTAPPLFVEAVNGLLNMSLPRLPLNMDAEDMIPTFVMLNVSI